MLKKMHMQEIQDLKLRGYSMNEIIHYFEERGRKPPSLPTLRKVFKMEALPEVPNQNLIKDKVFDHEPYRSAILDYRATFEPLVSLELYQLFWEVVPLNSDKSARSR